MTISNPDDWRSFNNRVLSAGSVSMDDPDVKHCMVLGKRNADGIKFVQAAGWVPEPDPNDFRQQYHLAVAARFIPDVTNCHYYFEVGAGIGAMARVLLKRNPSAQYDIYDLSALKQMQRKHLWDYRESVSWQAYPDEPVFDVALSPSAFIACYSLSEMDFEDRDKLILSHPFDYYLIVYQSGWGKMDNTKWFGELPGRTHGVTWEYADSTHLIGRRT